MTSTQDKTTSTKKGYAIGLQALQACQLDPKQYHNTADCNNSSISQMHQERPKRGAPAFELTVSNADMYNNNLLVKQYRQFCTDHSNLLEEIPTSTNRAFKGVETLDKLKRQNQFFVGVLIFANLYIQKLSEQQTHEWLGERFECVCRFAKTKLQKNTEASTKISNNSVLTRKEKDVGNPISSTSKTTDLHQENEGDLDGSVVNQETCASRTAADIDDELPGTSRAVSPSHRGTGSRQTITKGSGKPRIRINSQCKFNVERYQKCYGRENQIGRGRGRGRETSLHQEYSNTEKESRYSRKYKNDDARRGNSCRREERQRTEQYHSRNDRERINEPRDSRPNRRFRTDNEFRAETRPTRHRSRSNSANRTQRTDLRHVIQNKTNSHPHQKYKGEARIQSVRHSDARDRHRSRHNSDINNRARSSNESVSRTIKRSTVHKQHDHNPTKHTRNIQGEPTIKKTKEIGSRKMYDNENECQGYASDKARETDSFMSSGSSGSNASLRNSNTKLLARCAFIGSRQITHSESIADNSVSEMSGSGSETNESYAKSNHSGSESNVSYSKTKMCKSKTNLSDSESTHDVCQPKEPVEIDQAKGTLAPESSTLDNNLDCASDKSQVELSGNKQELSSDSEVSCCNSKSQNSGSKTGFSDEEPHNSDSNPNISNSETHQSDSNLNSSDSDTHISYSKTNNSDSKTNQHDSEPQQSDSEINHSESTTQNTITTTEENPKNRPKRAKELASETLKLPNSFSSTNHIDQPKDTPASPSLSDTNLKDSISDTAQFMAYLKSPSLSSQSNTSTLSRESDTYVATVKPLKNKPVYEVTLSTRRSEGFKRRKKTDSPMQSPQKVKHPKNCSPEVRHSKHNVIDAETADRKCNTKKNIRAEEHATTDNAVSSIDRNTTQTNDTTTNTPSCSGNTLSSVVRTKKRKKNKPTSKCNLTKIKQETHADEVNPVVFPPVGKTPTTLTQVEADERPVTLPACAVNQAITTHEEDRCIPVKIESIAGLLSGISHLFTKDQTMNMLSELCEIKPLLSPLSSEDEGENQNNTRSTHAEQSTSKDINGRSKKRISNVSESLRSQAKNGKPVKTDLEWFRYSREQLSKKKMNNKIVIKKELK